MIDDVLTVTEPPNESTADFKARVAELQRIAATWTEDPDRQQAMVEAYLRGEFQHDALTERREIVEFLREHDRETRTAG